MKFRILIAAVLFGFFSLCGCRKETTDVSRDDGIRYYLNQGDYRQAINLLKELLIDEPNNYRAKILLASAYSGSVGINTIDSFEVLRTKFFDQPLLKQAGSDQESPPKKQESLRSIVDEFSKLDTSKAKEETLDQKQLRAIRALEKELLKFAGQSSDALEVAFRLPHVPVNDRDRILLSLSILSDIPKDSDQYVTAQLYQGILSLI